ncbi:MAG: hypothetical protein ACPGXJ_03070 [Pseudomonadales bacterium]
MPDPKFVNGWSGILSQKALVCSMERASIEPMSNNNLSTICPGDAWLAERFAAQLHP